VEISKFFTRCSFPKNICKTSAKILVLDLRFLCCMYVCKQGAALLQNYFFQMHQQNYFKSFDSSLHFVHKEQSRFVYYVERNHFYLYLLLYYLHIFTFRRSNLKPLLEKLCSGTCLHKLACSSKAYELFQ
jgi:hypothetical protein